MSDDPSPPTDQDAVEIRCYFVRERNALLVRGDLAPLYTDFYLHLMEQGIRYETAQDQLIKDGFAALTLHLASRPWNEAIAWTLSWQDPRQNIFVTGSNRVGNVVGRVFTEDVAERDRNLFISQVTVAGQEPLRSVIEAKTLNFFAIAEDFYLLSEQRPGRYFHHSDDDFVLVAAQPDCDLEWLAGLDEEAIRTLDQKETLSLLETRHYRYFCGCGPDRILPLVSNLSDEALAHLFEDTEVITASCPRCGARYTITRETLEAFRGDQTR